MDSESPGQPAPYAQADLDLRCPHMPEATFSHDAAQITIGKAKTRSIAHLSHCILNRLSLTIYWKSPISILITPGSEIYIFLEKKMAKLFANSEDPDQTPHSAASDLGLHCLPITLLPVSRLHWIRVHNEICNVIMSSFNA